MKFEKLGRRNPWRPTWLKVVRGGVVRSARDAVVDLLVERAKRQPVPRQEAPKDAA